MFERKFAMFENLAVFENRLEELNLKLYDPTVAADRDLYRELMKEHKEITPIVEKYRELKNAEALIFRGRKARYISSPRTTLPIWTVCSRAQ